MVSVSIFALRDVIRRVQAQYKVPHNGTSHTSPSTRTDIEKLCKYLRTKELQCYRPKRENNQYATPARDLMAAGAEYANKAGAFKTFKRDTRKASNKGGAEHAPSIIRGDGNESEDDDEAYHDLGGDADLTMDDLTMDDEEFPSGTDLVDLMAMSQEVIDELMCYD
jgi:hypothetical protein